MEKKTIGGFISALRKANGMTQKVLAELLGAVLLYFRKLKTS